MSMEFNDQILDPALAQIRLPYVNLWRLKMWKGNLLEHSMCKFSIDLKDINLK